MYDREIFDFASEMAGCEVSETVLMTLCKLAAEELRQRLRAGVGAAGIKERFVTAAGVLALSMYIAAGAAPALTVSSFKAGNLSVSRGGAEAVSAASLRRQAERMLAAYLQDGDFAFLGVRA